MVIEVTPSLQRKGERKVLSWRDGGIEVANSLQGKGKVLFFKAQIMPEKNVPDVLIKANKFLDSFELSK